MKHWGWAGIWENCSFLLTSLSFKAKKPSAWVLTDTLARSGSGTLAFTWQVFWSARTTLFLVSKKIRAVPFQTREESVNLWVFALHTAGAERWRGAHLFLLRYLAVGSVDLVDHISQQDFLINSTAEFVILGVFAHLQVVSFEGLIHTVVRRERKKNLIDSLWTTQRSTETHWEINSLISSFIKQLTG